MSKSFFHNEKLCKGCRRKYYTVDKGGRKDKWFCFGIVTSEGREAYKIPYFDILRFCVKHPPAEKLPVENVFQLNMYDGEVKELIKGFSRLLNVKK